MNDPISLSQEKELIKEIRELKKSLPFAKPLGKI
jgi:hypothetical protein